MVNACFKSIIVSAVVVLGIGATAFSATRCNWRVSRNRAMELARTAASKAGYDLKNFPERSIKRSATQCAWLVHFAPPSPAAVHGDFLVTIEAATGKASVFQP